MEGKRSYTVPVLLVLMVIMGIVIVTLLTRWLVAEQKIRTDEGRQLAAQYAACVSFGEGLEREAEALAETDSAVKRLPVKARWGALMPVAQTCADLLVEAAVRAGESRERADAGIRAALRTVEERLAPVGNHEGPLTEEEARLVAAAAEAAGAWTEALGAYRVPTSDQNYRIMAGGGPWIEAAQEAAAVLRKLADRLQAP